MAKIKHKDIIESGNPFKETIAGLELLKKELAELKADAKKTAKELKSALSGNGMKGGDDLKNFNQQREESIRNTKQLTALQKEEIRIQKQLDTLRGKRINSIDKINKQLEIQKQRLKERIETQRESIKIDRAAEGSIEKLRLTTNKLTKDRDKLNRSTEAGKEEFDSLTKTINENNKELLSLDKQVGKNQRSVGNYEGAINKLKNGFLKVTGIIAGVAGVIAGFAKLAKEFKANNKISAQLNKTFGVQGEELRSLLVNVKTLSAVYEKDYNEIIQSANALSKEFGITGSEALELINKGFEKGADNTGEFLDILKEYPAQLKSVGLTADESIALITQQVNQGIYSDKGIDAIKEAGLRLRKNTKAVQDALIPLDEQLQLEIKSNVEKGKSFEAIRLISGALNDSSLSAKQVQTIIGDVFGGAGEEAGLRYLQNLKNINLELGDIDDQTSDIEKSQKGLTEAWTDFTTSLMSGENVVSRVLKTTLDGFAGILIAIKNISKPKLTQVEKDFNLLKMQIESTTDSADEFLMRLEKFAAEKEKEIKTTEELSEIAQLTGKLAVKIDLKRLKQIKEILVLVQRETLELKNKKAAQDKIAKQAKDAEQAKDKEIRKSKDVQVAYEQVIETKTEGLDILDDEIEKTNELLGIEEKLAKNRKEQADRDNIERTLKRQELKETFESVAKKTSEIGNIALDATGAASDAYQAQQNNQLSALQDRLDNGLISEKEFADKSKEINEKFAKKQQSIAVIESIINTAQATTKALASVPFPLNLIAAAVTTAAGVAQIALIKSQKFAEGGEVGGKKHSDGGTHIEAEKGEYVVKSSAYAQSKQITQDINSGLLSDAIYNNMMTGKTKMNQNVYMPVGHMPDSMMYSKMDKHISETQKTNMLLEKQRFISEDGTIIVDLNGNIKVNYSRRNKYKN